MKIAQYQDALKREYANYEERIMATRLGYGFLNRIASVVKLDDISAVSIYSESCDIHVQSKDPFVVEMQYIPAIAEMLNSKWTKAATDTGFIYSTYSYIKSKIKRSDFYVYVTITLDIADTCTIRRIATGRMTTFNKYVSVTEQEYETVIDCR